jgi:hypothetical protein
MQKSKKTGLWVRPGVNVIGILNKPFYITVVSLRRKPRINEIIARTNNI